MFCLVEGLRLSLSARRVDSGLRAVIEGLRFRVYCNLRSDVLFSVVCLTLCLDSQDLGGMNWGSLVAKWVFPKIGVLPLSYPT